MVEWKAVSKTATCGQSKSSSATRIPYMENAENESHISKHWVGSQNSGGGELLQYILHSNRHSMHPLDEVKEFHSAVTILE